MKYQLITLLFLLFFTSTASASEQNYNLSLSKDWLEDGHASSLAIYSGDDIVYGGMSLNYICSSEIIQYDDRKTIYPVYLFFGLKAPWKLSPFIEIGGDLGEIIVDSIFGNDEENNEPNVIDYYYSAGLNYSLDDKFSLSIYAKKYNFIFNDYIDDTLTIEKLYSTRPLSYGLGLSIKF